jgi:hypothetical protein
MAFKGFFKSKNYAFAFLIIVFIIIAIGTIATNVVYNKSYSLEPTYIICIPQGGIIDMCNVIYRCHEYAIKYNRILLIDTTTGWFNDDINDYIQFHSPYIYTGHPNTLCHKIKDLSVYPLGLNIMDMPLPEKRKNTNALGYSYYMNEKNLSYSLDKEFNERIMVYSMYRVGSFYFNDLLHFSSLSDIVKKAYESARSRLPSYYVGVHIRNTDYSSNVPDFINKHEALFAGKSLFVATDNRKSLDLFKEKYGSNVFSFTDITDNGGKPLHEGSIRNKEESRKYNIDTFVDIMLLASANEYYYSCHESGFSLAIAELRKEDTLIKRLLLKK